MKLCHLAAGAGSMYCGACARDVAMARALIARGHDVLIVPLYTPLRIESGAAPPISPVHLGALNAYLQQISTVFSRLPRPLARLLDDDGLLRRVASFGVRVKSSGLGPMTVSVLEGADGRQRAEFDRILRFLEDVRPDVVSITNSLLSGVAPAIKQHLGLPVLCEVKGEDGFIEGIPEPHRSQAIDLMRRNAQSIDRFVAPSDSYADLMAEYLQIDRERIHVVPSIVDADALVRSTDRVFEPFTLGYLSVITPRKGLHVLIDALASLRREDRDVRLVVAGQVLDRRYWREIRRTIRREGLSERVHYAGEISLAEKVELLQSLSCFCATAIKPEALGTASLEAMAAGVPVIAPDLGAFTEILDLAGGGLLVEPASAESLASAIARLIDDPDEADALGAAGAAGISRHFSEANAAAQMERILGSLTQGNQSYGGGPDGKEAVQAGR